MLHHPGDEQEPVEWNTINEQPDANQDLQNQISLMSEQMEKIVAQQAEMQKTIQTILLHQAESDASMREMRLKMDQSRNLQNAFQQNLRELSAEMTAELKIQWESQMNIQNTLAKLSSQNEQERKGIEQRVEKISLRLKELSTTQTSSQQSKAVSTVSQWVSRITNSPKIAAHPLIYLDFDRGRVIIELDFKDCSKISEFFLKIMRRQLTKGVELKYYVRQKNGYRHFLVCDHPFNTDASGGKMKKRNEKSEWGLAWVISEENLAEFVLSSDSVHTGYFGRVIDEGCEILKKDPGKVFVLNGYGVLE